MKKINKTDSSFYFVVYNNMGFPLLGRKGEKYEYNFEKSTSFRRTYYPIELEVGDQIKIANNEGKKTDRRLIDQYIGEVCIVKETNPSKRYGIVVDLGGQEVCLSADNVDIWADVQYQTGDLVRIKGALYTINDIMSDYTPKGSKYNAYSLNGITGRLNVWWVGDVEKSDESLHALPFKIPDLSTKYITNYGCNSIARKVINGVHLYIFDEDSYRPPSKVYLYDLNEQEYTELLEEYNDFEFVEIQKGIKFLNPKKKILNQLPKRKTLKDSLRNVGRDARSIRTRQTRDGNIIFEEVEF